MFRKLCSILIALTILFGISLTALSEDLGGGVFIIEENNSLKFSFIMNRYVEIDFLSGKMSKKALPGGAQVDLAIPIKSGKILAVNLRYDKKKFTVIIKIGNDAMSKSTDRWGMELPPVYICPPYDKTKISYVEWTSITDLDETIEKIPLDEPPTDPTPVVKVINVKWDKSEEQPETDASKVTTWLEIPKEEPLRPPFSIEGGSVSVQENILKFPYIIGRDLSIDFTSADKKIGDEVYSSAIIRDWVYTQGARTNLQLPLRGQKKLVIALEYLWPLEENKKFFVKVVEVKDDTKKITEIESTYTATSGLNLNLPIEQSPIICSYDKKITRLEWTLVNNLNDIPLFIPSCYEDGTQVVNVKYAGSVSFKRRCMSTMWGRIKE